MFVCVCMCINGCYRPKSRGGIILSNLLSAGLGISRMLEASLSSLLSSFSFRLPNGSFCFTLSLSLSSALIQTVSISAWCSNFVFPHSLSLPLSLTSLRFSLVSQQSKAAFIRKWLWLWITYWPVMKGFKRGGEEKQRRKKEEMGHYQKLAHNSCCSFN